MASDQPFNKTANECVCSHFRPFRTITLSHPSAVRLFLPVITVAKQQLF